MYDDRLTDDLVERMHDALATAMHRTRPDPFGSPVSVAEIYQDLVPYRTVRTDLGFDMNADYEHTLLRLLAGERDLARLEPAEARDELRSELESPNPNVGLFRKFAACDVWIAPGGNADPKPVIALERVPDDRAEPGRDDDGWDPRGLSWEHEDPELGAAFSHDIDPIVPAPPAPAQPAHEPPAAGWTEELAETELLLEDAIEIPVEDALSDILIPDEAAPLAAPSQHATSGGEMTVGASSAVAREGTTDTGGAPRCAFCDSNLPAGRMVRFCAYCGADQSTLPCAACGEVVEQGWNYCIACGANAPSTADG